MVLEVVQDAKMSGLMMPLGGSSFKRSLKDLRHLESVIEGCVAFRDKINIESVLSNGVEVVSNEDDLIKIMRLRSQVFTPMGYNRQFPERIVGLNFDDYDRYSIILMTKRDGEITATSRLILDSELGLQSEKIDDFATIIARLKDENERQGYTVAEGSRTAILPEYRASVEFKKIVAASYLAARALNVGDVMSSMPTEMFQRLYTKVGMEEVGRVNNYGELQQSSVLLSWPMEKVTPFFKRAFLSEREEERLQKAS